MSRTEAAPAAAELGGRPVASGDRARFVALYGHLFEHSPWVIERAWDKRPFADAGALHAALLQVLAEAAPSERVALVRAHPQLADKAAIAQGLTESSAAEQASAGLDRLTAEEYATFHALNRAYRDRFGFPFIICAKLHHKEEILAAMRRRLVGEPQGELDEALTQVGLISRLRLADVQAGDAR
jgi:2-oxo-4-hydroxy-4-carboxy-5-ureidoimidazoline decarboxylase